MSINNKIKQWPDIYKGFYNPLQEEDEEMSGLIEEVSFHVTIGNLKEYMWSKKFLC